VTGLGLLAGSMAAGELTAALGYGTTFAFAAAALVASFVFLKASFKKAAEPIPATRRLFASNYTGLCAKLD
jgi:hypothetical protein